jgi:hypothetical protein
MSAGGPHGEMRTYRRGCRCLPCKAASANYKRDRRSICLFPDPAELLPAAGAELYLAELRARGVGYRQAAQLAGLSDRFILDVRAGKVPTLRADTLTRILAIRPALAHGQHVMGWRTARLINSLEREGYTRGRIARALGRQSPRLQIGRRKCTVKNALRVRTLYRHINVEGEPDGVQ